MCWRSALTGRDLPKGRVAGGTLGLSAALEELPLDLLLGTSAS
jgi:hypothetical protein